jgi:hypothetical protein
MNEIGHKCDTRFIRRNKNGNVVVPPPFGLTNEDELYLTHANFPILNNNMHTINIRDHDA